MNGAARDFAQWRGYPAQPSLAEPNGREGDERRALAHPLAPGEQTVPEAAAEVQRSAGGGWHVRCRHRAGPATGAEVPHLQYLVGVV